MSSFGPLHRCIQMTRSGHVLKMGRIGEVSIVTNKNDKRSKKQQNKIRLHLKGFPIGMLKLKVLYGREHLNSV